MPPASLNEQLAAKKHANLFDTLEADEEEARAAQEAKAAADAEVAKAAAAAAKVIPLSADASKRFDQQLVKEVTPLAA